MDQETLFGKKSLEQKPLAQLKLVSEPLYNFHFATLGLCDRPGDYVGSNLDHGPSPSSAAILQGRSSFPWGILDPQILLLYNLLSMHLPSIFQAVS
jgi:hypothetical protein